MRQTAAILLLCFVFVLVAGCVVSKPTLAPPPLKKEIKSRQPGPNYVWLPGHWKWTSGKYIWVPGHWTKKRAGKTWVSGHWEKRGRHWVWIAGRWR